MEEDGDVDPFKSMEKEIQLPIWLLEGNIEAESEYQPASPVALLFRPIPKKHLAKGFTRTHLCQFLYPSLQTSSRRRRSSAGLRPARSALPQQS